MRDTEALETAGRLARLKTPGFIDRLYRDWKLRLERRAIWETSRADNYRGCKVGACGLGLCKRPYADFIVWSDACWMPIRSGERRCAEHSIFERMRRGDAWLVALVVAGPAESDDETGIDVGWRVPCGKTCQPVVFGELDKFPMDAFILPETKLVLIDTDRANLPFETSIERLKQYRDHALQGSPG